MGRRKGRRKARPSRNRRLRRYTLVTAALVLAAGAAWLVWPFWRLAGQFEERTARRPTRLYARSTVLEVGGRASLRRLAEELEASGYRRVDAQPSGPGRYRSSSRLLDVHLRSFPTAQGWREAGRLEVRLAGSRVVGLRWRGEEVRSAPLEPALLATYLGPDMAERRPVALRVLPDHLVRAVLAAEDARFFQHPGLSLSGILRAAWVNLRGGELRQGGSTLTQQLVKNLFLTHERTLARKLREIVLALLIDLRHDKRAILGAYLNEIYWGASGAANLIGVGAASWAYFGKHPAELDLCESALLAGMIRSPGGYSPRLHPERARERRDWVLERMGRLSWLEPEALEREVARELCFEPHPVVVKRAPFFADAALAEARERFGLREPTTSGWTLLSTLDWAGQRQAEEAVAWGLEALEQGWEKGRDVADPLQASLVSLEPGTGALLAYVGGRDYGASQFDRAASARRQAGSAFKPMVYATAFESGVAWPAGFVQDAPIMVELADRRWVPQNSDGDYEGWVTVRTAVERSLNIPTVRVALASDLRRIVQTSRRMGLGGRMQPVPALALGAFEVTPVELATAYATLAAGGLRPPVHALRAALDRERRPVTGTPLPAPERALSAETAYLMTSVLQGVLERGTARSARDQGLLDPLAGKTGTTNGRRDSWFVGYSPDRSTLVWVGYDDNSETRLSGTRAALPIWIRFTWGVRPLGGFPVFEQPPGVVTALIDPESGELATEDCPRVLTEVYRAGRVPESACRLHGFWRDWQPRRADQEDLKERRRWRWLRRVFGRKSQGPPG